MKPSDALAAHRAELRQLVSRHGLARARVFGSVLTGTDDDESDLDLPVDPLETTSLLTLTAFQHEAEQLLGVPVFILTPNALPAKFWSEVSSWLRRYEARGARQELPWAYCRGHPTRHQLRSAVCRAVNHINRAAPEFIAQHPR